LRHFALQKKNAFNGNILVVPAPRRHHLFGMPIFAQLASDGLLDTAYGRISGTFLISHNDPFPNHFRRFAVFWLTISPLKVSN
jgi:hypothetical protein